MTDSPQPSDLQDVPEAVVVRERSWIPSLVWLIPIVAALVGLSLVIQAVINQGPTITISFVSAEGLEAGKTKVKFKDVDIGVIKAISLSEDRRRVITTVELSKEAEAFAAADSRFWVVKPRVGASGISGLGTLLSGAYIGVDAGKSAQTKKVFTGLDAPPVVTADVPGTRFTLQADDLGSLDVGSLIYYRRIQAGQVVGYKLDSQGRGVALNIFVNAPYDQFVTTDTRFWHASGVDIQLDAGGFKVNTQSLATVVAGGIAFQAPLTDEPVVRAPAETTFRLAADQSGALKAADGQALMLVTYFQQSLRGLVVGAPVDFRGVVLGEVKSIGVAYDRSRQEFRMPVTLVIYPERLRGIKLGSEPGFLAKLVKRGLRAQLRTGSFLTGQLYVALDFFPKAPAAELDESRTPLVLPTLPGSLDELQTAVAEIVNKVQKIPFDQIGNHANETLVTLNGTLRNMDKLIQQIDGELAPEAKAALTEARKAMGSAAETLATDNPLQQDLRNTLTELSKAAQSLRVLTEYLERHPEALLRGKKEDSE